MKKSLIKTISVIILSALFIVEAIPETATVYAKSKVKKIGSVLQLTEKSTAKSDDIIILYTNDVHCQVDENIGYSGLSAYKESLKQTNNYVSLVDLGDALSGDTFGSYKKGESIISLMNVVGYDFAVPGAHEFEYGLERLSYLIGKSNAIYLTSNISYTGSGKNALIQTYPYMIVPYGDISVGFIGVTEPNVVSECNSALFTEKDAADYDFKAGNNGNDLYANTQKNIDACKAAGANYIVLLTYLGSAKDDSPYSSRDLIVNTTGVDVVLDGGYHEILPCEIISDKDGDDVALSTSGSGLNGIGKLVISTTGNITTTVVTGYKGKNSAIDKYITDYRKTIEESQKKKSSAQTVPLAFTTLKAS